MAENPRPPDDGDPHGDDEERPQILPPEEPGADAESPWSHAEEGRSVSGGEDAEPPSATGALLALGGGLVVIVAAIGVVVSLLTGGDPAKKPTHPTPTRAAPSSKQPFPTPTTPTPRPPHRAIDLPHFSGEPSEHVGRIDDRSAGLSYVRLGRPWRDGVPFRTSGFTQGQYYITERYSGGAWQATIMSGRMTTQMPEYVGTYRWFRSAVAQATDVAGRYYPKRHRTLEIASQPVDVDGRPGWLVASRLYFREPGLRATSELMVVVAVDTGQADPGVLYVSIPNTENKHLPDVNALLSSLRVIK